MAGCMSRGGDGKGVRGRDEDDARGCLVFRDVGDEEEAIQRRAGEEGKERKKQNNNKGDMAFQTRDMMYG